MVPSSIRDTCGSEKSPGSANPHVVCPAAMLGSGQRAGRESGFFPFSKAWQVEDSRKPGWSSGLDSQGLHQAAGSSSASCLFKLYPFCLAAAEWPTHLSRCPPNMVVASHSRHEPRCGASRE